MFYTTTIQKEETTSSSLPKGSQTSATVSIIPVSQMGEPSVTSTGFVSPPDSSRAETAQRKMK